MIHLILLKIFFLFFISFQDMYLDIKLYEVKCVFLKSVMFSTSSIFIMRQIYIYTHTHTHTFLKVMRKLYKIGKFYPEGTGTYQYNYRFPWSHNIVFHFILITECCTWQNCGKRICVCLCAKYIYISTCTIIQVVVVYNSYTR